MARPVTDQPGEDHTSKAGYDDHHPDRRAGMSDGVADPHVVTVVHRDDEQSGHDRHRDDEANEVASVASVYSASFVMPGCFSKVRNGPVS